MSRHSHVEKGWGIAVSYYCDGCGKKIESDNGYGYVWPVIKVEGLFYCYSCLKTSLKHCSIVARDEASKTMVLSGQRLENWDGCSHNSLNNIGKEEPFYFADKTVRDRLQGEAKL